MRKFFKILSVAVSILFILILLLSYGISTNKLNNLVKNKIQNNITIENSFIYESDFFKWFSMADFIIQTNTSATQSGITALSIYFEKIMITTASGGIRETLNEKNSFICQKNMDSISLKILEACESNNEKKTNELKKLKKSLNWDKFSNNLINFIK